ncbi:PRTRC system protein B [Flavobacterium sp. Sd200]|uniref:PRTRC system protein B n=1 Tax=Flavobacterium sp. Sd200 TaxID=2692211 RepID=UPI001367C5A8|nr:PRTRC system protein B [Flavobacterium sp. Sd200]MXN91111.1 PRTRC system protein B [Flavobacterium sp. Sd200]
MNDITQSFGTLYHPVKAFVVYEKDGAEQHRYVESYDMDDNGCPINAHPLSVKEATALAKALDTSEELQRNFLKSEGLLPKNVLYINPTQGGYMVWQTPRQRAMLYFTDSLKIPNGIASIPPLVWRATKDTLWIYALADDNEVTAETPLYRAPFFNLYNDGKVCMGTVKISIPADCLLEEFMQQWQRCFFESYFSHTLGDSPVKGNIIQLWQRLARTKKQFPVKSLVQTRYTLKNLLK